jgi:hypothetical protein
MSFVSVIARENFISVMSDGRVSHKGQSVAEDYQKFVSFTPYFFIAFAGDKEPSELLLQALKMIGLPDMIEKLGFDMVSLFIQTSILTVAQKGYRVMIAFGGKNPLGEIEFYYLDTANPQTRKMTPKGQDIQYCFLKSENAQKINTDQLLIDTLQITGLDTSIQIADAQKRINDHISDLDTSVNKNTFQLIIER